MLEHITSVKETVDSGGEGGGAIVEKGHCFPETHDTRVLYSNICRKYLST